MIETPVAAPVRLIDRYLAEQADLTAVERFARRHDDGTADVLADGAGVYHDLLPAAPPGPGQQYAFAVDLDACSGCKACVTACHNLNGLDPGESFRSVGVLHGGSVENPWQQTVTTACHHCVEPACLAGCPVDAYEKDPVTGIVRHLDDQCIGCSYCTLTCPYEVPRFNDRLGIVRKCDLCADRLAVGEAPACVQACPNGAIAVTVVDTAVVAAGAAAAPADALVPGAPPSGVTLPTTQYTSTRAAPATARAADHHAVAPAHAHPPLAAMLVLSQAAVGAFVLGDTIAQRAATVVAALALAVSVLHLGRPQHAWRAVIGLRHSWLSREIVVFGAFVGLALGATVLPALTVVAQLTGLAGVGCSAMIYAVTRRRWWRLARTGPRFAASAAITGAALVVATDAVAGHAPVGLALGLAGMAAAKVAGEALLLRHRGDDTDLGRTAFLLSGALRPAWRRRIALGLAGGVLVPLTVSATAASAPVAAAVLAIGGAIAVTGGELDERNLFFRAVAAPRMPGGFR